MGAAQIGSVVEGHTAGQLYVTMRFTVAKEHRSLRAKRQALEGLCRNPQLRDEAHTCLRVYCLRRWVSLVVQRLVRLRASLPTNGNAPCALLIPVHTRPRHFTGAVRASARLVEILAYRNRGTWELAALRRPGNAQRPAVAAVGGRQRAALLTRRAVSSPRPTLRPGSRPDRGAVLT